VEDVVVDCDVVGHTMNEAAGQSHRSATLFVADLVESDVRACIDEAGFILTEYQQLGLTESSHPLVKAFIKHLVRPGKQCVTSEECLTPDQRQAVAHLAIDQHDRRYIRIAACTVSKWLVSNDTTYLGNDGAVLTASGVVVEHSRDAVQRFAS